MMRNNLKKQMKLSMKGRRGRRSGKLKKEARRTEKNRIIDRKWKKII